MINKKILVTIGISVAITALLGIYLIYNQLQHITSVEEKEIPCAKEGERVNRNPLLGPTDQKCYSGLIEVKVSKSYSVCEKRTDNIKKEKEPIAQQIIENTLNIWTTKAMDSDGGIWFFMLKDFSDTISPADGVDCCPECERAECRYKKPVKLYSNIIFAYDLIRWYQISENEKYLKDAIKTEIPKKIVKKETAGWKTYRNGKYGFEIKYPKNWKLWITQPDEFSPHGNWGEQIGELAIFQSRLISKPYCEFHLTVYSNLKNLSIRDFWKAPFPEVYKFRSSNDIIFGEEQNSGVKFSMERTDQPLPNESTAVITKKDSNIIELFWWGEILLYQIRNV